MAYYQRYMQLGLLVIFANARMIICIIKKNPFHHATFFLWHIHCYNSAFYDAVVLIKASQS